MSKISMIGTLQAQPGKGDQMAAVLTDMVDAAAEEPGVEVYSYHRSGDDFWFFALMADAEAMEHHGQSPAMQQAMAAFMPLAAGRPQMTATTPVAAIGLDL